MKIKDVAEVLTGYTFRERMDAYPAGGIAVIQMKNIDAGDHLQLDDIAMVDVPDVNQRQLLREGDLVVRSRGLFHTAALVPRFAGRMLAAAPLMVIRLNAVDVLPDYVRWFVNSAVTQTILAKLGAGSYVRTLNKAAVENLEIPLPPMERQKQIVRVAELAARERELMKAVAEKRLALLETMLTRCAKAEANFFHNRNGGTVNV